MRITPFLLIILLSVACAETRKTAVEKMELTSSNYNCDVEIIINKMPSPTPAEHTTYCIVNLSPKSGTFESNWKIRRFKLNATSYFTLDYNEFNGKGENLYTNNIREIILEEENQVWIEFENDKGGIIEFIVDRPTISTVH